MCDSEEIECAAFRFGDEVRTGSRHHAIRAEYCSPGTIGESGFVTTRGRFVDRHEAARIAFAAGQIREPLAELYSEDLHNHLNMLHHARTVEARMSRKART